MKCVVTILQNKRVALPFLFGKYSLPAMRKAFGGEVKLYHIFHDMHVEDKQLQSNKVYDLSDVNRVWEFIYRGFYNEAKFVPHQEVNTELLSLPSMMKAAEVAIEEKADFHLWLEDDAIVYDLECGKWAELMKGATVGLYRSTVKQQMINPSFFVSTVEYDRKLLEALKDYKKEPHEKFAQYGSQIEHLLWTLCENPVLLNSAAAQRHHPYGTKWSVWLPELKEWLKSTIPDIQPEHVGLLDIDFAK